MRSAVSGRRRPSSQWDQLAGPVGRLAGLGDQRLQLPGVKVAVR